MSRVGEKPIDVPDGVTVSVDGLTVTAKGGLGELVHTMPGPITIEVADGKVLVGRTEDTREGRSFHGLVRSLVANMVEGVAKGFSKDLEIQGVGFKAAVQGRKLVMTLGFSSPIEYEPPEGVTVVTQSDTSIVVSGMDKQKVGDTAARIRAFCPAEPYKGKGLRYRGEYVRRKVGKTVA